MILILEQGIIQPLGFPGSHTIDTTAITEHHEANAGTTVALIDRLAAISLSIYLQIFALRGLP